MKLARKVLPNKMIFNHFKSYAKNFVKAPWTVNELDHSARHQNGLVKINDTLFNQQYEYIPATVINSTLTKRNNYFTLNVGYAQGVKRGMGVFSEKGIVGRVHNSSKHFAVVKSVLTENINIDVMLDKGGAFGLLKWDGENAKYVQISGISHDMRIKKWSTVSTKGGSGIFPRGIPVGKVVEKRFMEGRPLWDIHLLTAVDFRTVQHVYVVKNIHLDELEQLFLWHEIYWDQNVRDVGERQKNFF
jgi:rod shape-determining protein MreC